MEKIRTTAPTSILTWIGPNRKNIEKKFSCWVKIILVDVKQKVQIFGLVFTGSFQTWARKIDTTINLLDRLQEKKKHSVIWSSWRDCNHCGSEVIGATIPR